MNEREDTAHRPYTKLIGAEILAKDYSNDPPDSTAVGAATTGAKSSLTDPTSLYGKDVRASP